MTKHKHEEEEGLVDLLKAVYEGLKWKRTDDWFDQLNHRTTVIILLAMAAVVSFFQFEGSPIVCWCPAHFTDAQVKYANSFCWVRNTYYLPFEREIPNKDHHEQKLLYYQWIPFILMIQAILYVIPSLLWHGLNTKGGIDTDDILRKAVKSNTESTAHHMDRFLKTRKPEKGYGIRYLLRRCLMHCWHMCGGRTGGFLVVLFMCTKVLYMANAIGQFYLLNWILFDRFNMYGFEVVQDVAADHNWHDSPFDAFPRVTMCDMEIRRLGNVHRYTLQCALPLNRINEKVYMFLWFWMAFVAGATIFSFLQWMVYLIVPGDNLRFISNHLHLPQEQDQESGQASLKTVQEFIQSYLKKDGVFLLRLISHNTGRLISSDITGRLFEIWESRKE